MLNFGKYRAEWCVMSPFRGPPALEARLSDFSAEVAKSPDILRSSRSFLCCSRTVSRSSHFTEVPDAVDMTDEPVNWMT
jgi:hypothetical protein